MQTSETGKPVSLAAPRKASTSLVTQNTKPSATPDTVVPPLPATSSADGTSSTTEHVASNKHGTALAPVEEASDEQFRNALLEAQEKSLFPLKEDVAEWLSRLMGVAATADNLLEILRDGSVLCRLARLIDSRLQPPVQSRVKFHSRAPAESWLARDNTAMFLQWAKEFGVEEGLLFESDGLVLQRDPQRVVLCLLEIARIASTKGATDAPSIVIMERAVCESEEKEAIGHGDEKARTAECPTAGPSNAKTCTLDDQIAALTKLCRCPTSFSVTKTSVGVYVLGGKQCLIRLLRDRHVMVRVGGGWDSLEHYLLCHDPCRILQFVREGATVSPVAVGGGAKQTTKEDRILRIEGKYKSPAAPR